MALPAWPVGLTHKPLREPFGVKEAYRKPRVTEFEDGPALMRKTSLQRRAALKMKLDFTTMAEFERFRRFVENDLANGTARFTMPVWVPALADYAPRTVQIENGVYSADAAGIGMAVTFTLYVYDW